MHQAVFCFFTKRWITYIRLISWFSGVAFGILLLPYALCASQQPDQPKTITLALHNEPLRNVLAQISTKSGYRFNYANDIYDFTTPVSIEVKNKTVEETMVILLQDKGLTFGWQGKNIILKKQTVQANPTAQISGRIKDADTHEPLIGATVQLTNTATGMTSFGASTDETGSFSLKQIPADTYLLRASYTGYALLERNITLKDGQALTVNLTLRSSATTTEEVVVDAKRISNSETAVLSERRKSVNEQDAISAQAIERSASITTTQALQRVPGVSITDGRYVAIRGLGDRNVVVQLNGARLSSANSDRNAVALDLVPAQLLDNLSVIKTQTPDRPADAVAGIIELKTLSIPDSFRVTVTAQAGFNNAIGVGGYFNSFKGADVGFFGEKANQAVPQALLDLKIPNDVLNGRYSASARAEADYVNKVENSLPYTLNTSYRKAPVNQIYSITAGTTFHIFGGHALGVLIGASYYHRAEAYNNAISSQYSIYQGALYNSTVGYTAHVPVALSPNNLGLIPYSVQQTNYGADKVSAGSLAAVSYKISSLNEVSAYFLGNLGGETSGLSQLGSFPSAGLYPGSVGHQELTLRTTYRTFTTLQLRGEHKFWKGELSPQFSWNASTSYSLQKDPDLRNLDLAIDSSLLKQPQLGQSVYTYLYQGTSGRFFRHLGEDNYNLTADLKLPFRISSRIFTVKVGGYYLQRKRNYTENYLGFPVSPNPYGFNVIAPDFSNPDDVLSPNKVGILPAPQGFPAPSGNEGTGSTFGFIYNNAKSPNNYAGTEHIRSFYAMAEIPIIEKLTLVGGIRLEQTAIHVALDTVGVATTPPGTIPQPNQRQSGTGLAGFQTDYRPFWSGSLIYRFKEDMNFRLSFSQTLARPEMREIAPISQFDAYQNAFVKGDVDLRNERAENLDFRWEWFPHPGEVISVSAFSKRIYDQITRQFSFTNPTGNNGGLGITFLSFVNSFTFTPVINVANDPEVGKVYGLEFEVRKDLGLLWSPLKHFYAGGNLLLAASSIRRNPDRLTAARLIDRNASDLSPVFEQPPYVVNLNVGYENSAWGTALNAYFVMTGERLVEVQLTGSPDVYDRPSPQLDFIFTQRIYKRLQFRAFAKNVLNSPILTTYTTPGNGGHYGTYDQTYIQHRYRQGVEYSMGLSYTF